MIIQSPQFVRVAETGLHQKPRHSTLHKLSGKISPHANARVFFRLAGSSSPLMFVLFHGQLAGAQKIINKNSNAISKWGSGNGYSECYLSWGDTECYQIFLNQGNHASRKIYTFYYLCLKNIMTSAYGLKFSSWPAGIDTGRPPKYRTIFIFNSSKFHSNTIGPPFLSNPPESPDIITYNFPFHIPSSKRENKHSIFQL